jgi:arylsulfatase
MSDRSTGSDGSILPFPPTQSASIAGLTIEDSVYRKREQPRRLPDDAPNILLILIDDVGPATASTFGGEISTPTMDRVAEMGITYNRFRLPIVCTRPSFAISVTS